MRKLVHVTGSLMAVIFLVGCLTASQYKFSLNYSTGEVQREYFDLTSRKGVDEKDYSVANDWTNLQEMVEKKQPELDPDVVEDLSRELFEENNVLCGKELQKVRCPKCFPSKAALLSFLHEPEWRFEMINDEVVLFLPSSKKIISSNGQVVTTPRNSLIFWPSDTEKFEYVASEQWSGGTSLLPYYLKAKDRNKPQHK